MVPRTGQEISPRRKNTDCRERRSHACLHQTDLLVFSSCVGLPCSFPLMLLRDGLQALDVGGFQMAFIYSAVLQAYCPIRVLGREPQKSPVVTAALSFVTDACSSARQWFSDASVYSHQPGVSFKSVSRRLGWALAGQLCWLERCPDMPRLQGQPLLRAVTRSSQWRHD